MRVVQSDLVRERPALTKHYDSSNLNQLETRQARSLWDTINCQLIGFLFHHSK